MLAAVPRLPFSLHPLVAEAKRRARRRRTVVLAAVVILAGGGSGAVAAFHPFGLLRSTGAMPATLEPGGVFTGTGGLVSTYDTASLDSVSVASSRSAWIVGSVAWRWDGGAWRSAPLPRVPGGSLDSVAAIAPDDAWAVGNTYRDGRAHALVEHWNGTRWTRTPLPRDPGASLYSISAAGREDVWAIGVNSVRRPVLLRWAGAVWRLQPLPRLEPKTWPEKVVANGPASVWVVGYRGRTSVIEHWDGSRWLAVPSPFGPDDPVSDFTATSSTDAWAVGSYGQGGSGFFKYSHPLAARWDGTSWTLTSVPGPAGSNSVALGAVAAGRGDDVWATGSGAYQVITHNSVESSDLQAFLLHWNGRRWTVALSGLGVASSGPSDARIDVGQDGTAWAIASCGVDNLVLHETSTGWASVPHPKDRHWRANFPVRGHRPLLGSCPAVGG